MLATHIFPSSYRTNQTIAPLANVPKFSARGIHTGKEYNWQCPTAVTIELRGQWLEFYITFKCKKCFSLTRDQITSIYVALPYQNIILGRALYTLAFYASAVPLWRKHCGCRGVIVEPAALIQALGVNDSVPLLLQANDGHGESIVRITSHLHVRFFQYLLVGSAYSNHNAVLEHHSKMCSVPSCSQRFL